MKYFFIIATLICITSPLAVNAGTYTPTNYQPLAPLPGTQVTGTTSVELDTYIPGMFKLAIGVAAALAVVMIVIGGVQYLSTDAISGKNEGKERIENALIGLFLAIGAYVILNTINPGILNFNLSIKKPANIGAPQPPSGPTSTPPTLGTWFDDSAERAQLAAMGISINKSNCQNIGDSNCTSVYALSGSAMAGLSFLSSNCTSCISGSIVLTGGTEYWLHGNRNTNMNNNPTLHKPGGGAVDLSKDPDLDAYIQNFPKVSSPNGCSTGQGYNINGTTYVDEQITGNPPHWHICY